MSASLHFHIPFALKPRLLSEIELLRLISQITWSGYDEALSLDSLATVLVRLPGLNGFRFEPVAGMPHLRAYESPNLRLAISNASSRSSVSASGINWGQMRLFFDPQALSPDTAARLGRFLGQQIGLLFHRIQLQRKRRELLSTLEGLHRILPRRKLILGAAEVFAKQHNISQTEAISQMVEYARRNHRSLLAISEALILGFDAAVVTRPFFRRLAVHEPTTSRQI